MRNTAHTHIKEKMNDEDTRAGPPSDDDKKHTSEACTPCSSQHSGSRRSREEVPVPLTELPIATPIPPPLPDDQRKETDSYNAAIAQFGAELDDEVDQERCMTRHLCMLYRGRCESLVDGIRTRAQAIVNTIGNDKHPVDLSRYPVSKSRDRMYDTLAKCAANTAEQIFDDVTSLGQAVQEEVDSMNMWLQRMKELAGGVASRLHTLQEAQVPNPGDTSFALQQIRDYTRLVQSNVGQLKALCRRWEENMERAIIARHTAKYITGKVRRMADMAMMPVSADGSTQPPSSGDDEEDEESEAEC